MLRINVWLSFNGLQEGAFSGASFPYVALYPSKGKKDVYRSITDVYDETKRLYQTLVSQGYELGTNLYQYTFNFVDHALLVSRSIQNRIKEYQFCKQFNCSPYPSLKETPAIIIEQFSVIEEEFNSCVKKKQEENNNA